MEMLSKPSVGRPNDLRAVLTEIVLCCFLQTGLQRVSFVKPCMGPDLAETGGN